MSTNDQPCYGEYMAKKASGGPDFHEKLLGVRCDDCKHESTVWADRLDGEDWRYEFDCPECHCEDATHYPPDDLRDWVWDL